MIKIAICDDEREDRELIQNLVTRYMEESGEEYELKLFVSGKQFLDSGFIPDIIFLDIMIPDKNGIEVGIQLKRLSKRVLIVYTTYAGGEVMFALNHLHSFGFLVKPILEKHILSMLEDAVLYINKKQDVDPVANIVAFVLEDGTSISLNIMDIFYFEYSNRKIKVVTRNQTYICKEKISDSAEKMKEHGFAMSHQSFVVNLYYVDRIEGSMLVMRNGDKVYLAQKRASTLRKQLMIGVRK